MTPVFHDFLAEREGFEPSKAFTLPLFESGQFNHSCTSPCRFIITEAGLGDYVWLKGFKIVFVGRVDVGTVVVIQGELGDARFHG